MSTCPANAIHLIANIFVKILIGVGDRRLYTSSCYGSKDVQEPKIAIRPCSISTLAFIKRRQLTMQYTYCNMVDIANECR